MKAWMPVTSTGLTNRDDVRTYLTAVPFAASTWPAR